MDLKWKGTGDALFPNCVSLLFSSGDYLRHIACKARHYKKAFVVFGPSQRQKSPNLSEVPPFWPHKINENK
jgi:hypothetical protein